MCIRDRVTLYASSLGKGKTVSAPTENYTGLLENAGKTRNWDRWPPRTALARASILKAVSGAALSPSLGRSDLGTTNALLAAFNVRLGAWVPNPRYAVNPSGSGFKRLRVSYVFRELFGLYDTRDPYLYVTDGGHWENLGLVELLRRECETIICVDASGDSPGDYKTLREALDLAGLELGDGTSYPRIDI